jgi:hypothetical protein
MSCLAMKKAVSAAIWGLLWLALEVGASASTLNIENHNLDFNYGGAFTTPTNGDVGADTDLNLNDAGDRYSIGRR